jgi:N-acetylglucosamine malate deacetylase 1
LKILIIVAHPDDEVIGMGGTILKHREKGDTVKIIYLATGITSRRKSGHVNVSDYKFSKKESDVMKKEIEKLRVNAKNSCKCLKVTKQKFYDFPDNEMDSIPLLKVIKVIEKEIDEIKPEIVYTHHYGDLNIDHRVVFNAVLTACRPINSSVREMISFYNSSSTEWNYPSKFNPNYFVNITKQLSYKINAMKEYREELREFPHPRSLKNLKNTAQYWGSISDCIAAESFEIIRKIEK